MGLHIVGDAGITRDLPGALDDKNVGQHRPGKQTERASPPDKEIEVGVKSARLNQEARPFLAYIAPVTSWLLRRAGARRIRPGARRPSLD
jgi:hypothetical protein